MLFLILYATLISDEIHINTQTGLINMHRLTSDSTAKYTQMYFNTKNHIYGLPVDAKRYYFSSDSFYLVTLDQNWERIVWQKCKDEGSRGFYSSGKMMRLGGSTHNPGFFRKPSSIDVCGNIIVADYNNNKVSEFDVDYGNDTLVLINEYIGPYGGLNLSLPNSIAMGKPFYSYLYILDSGNDRYIKIFLPWNEFRYAYDGVDEGIPMDEIREISVKGITINLYYVFLLSKDKIYLLEEKSTTPIDVKLLNVLHFPGANFTGMDVSSEVLLVVDNSRGIILGLAPDLSRSYFAYSNSSELSYGVFNVAIDGDEITTFAPFFSSTGIDYFKLDLSSIPDDAPHDLSYKSYEDRIVLDWYGDGSWGSDEYDNYVIERKEETSGYWEPVIWRDFMNSHTTETDFNVERGKTYFYRVRAYRTNYYSGATDSVSVTVPYLSRPTHLQTVFKDSAVELTWNDNSSLNWRYYIGKKVNGQYQGNDTTFWMGYYPYKNPNLEIYIDTLPIEGNNIYRVAAIDSTSSYWYSDFDTIFIPVEKASDLHVFSLPDTSSHITFKRNSKIITGGSIRRKKISESNYSTIKWFNEGESPEFTDNDIDPDETYIYKCHTEQRYDNIYYYWNWCENPDSVIYQWSLDTIPPAVEFTGVDPDFGGMAYNLEWIASDDGDIYTQKLYYSDDTVNLSDSLREYIIDKGNYNGWYTPEIIVEDYSGLMDSDNKYVALYNPDSIDISINLWLENPTEISRVYLNYEVPEVEEYYKVYQKKNNNNWSSSSKYIDNTTGDIFLQKLNPGDSLYAFMSKESGNNFLHYSNKDKITNSSGGGGQCPLLYVFTDSGYVLDNSLLPRSEYIKENYEDKYILRITPDIKDNYKFMLIDNLDNAYIDRVRFFALDHPDSVEVGVTNKGKAIPYKIVDLPLSAIDNKGMDWVDSVKSVKNGCYKGIKKKNDTLNVEFRNREGDYIGTLAEPPPPPPKERLSLSGDTIYTRIKADNILNIKKGTVAYTLIDSTAKIDYIYLADELHMSYLKEIKAKAINIPEELENKDGNYYVINPGDTLEFSFLKVDKGIPPTWKRDYMIEVYGYYKESRKGKQALEGTGKFTDNFRLIRSIGKVITLEFESSEDRNVTIDIYDALGRNVRNESVKLSKGIKRYTIDGLLSGIYFLRTDKIDKETHKITIVR